MKRQDQENKNPNNGSDNRQLLLSSVQRNNLRSKSARPGPSKLINEITTRKRSCSKLIEQRARMMILRDQRKMSNQSASGAFEKKIGDKINKLQQDLKH